MNVVTIVRRLGVASAAAMLAACASTPPDHFYTLGGGGDVPAAAPAPAANPVYIEVMGVVVPAQVRRSQLVVSEGPGRVDLLEQHRWAGPLADEIGRALSLKVSAELGAIDVYRTPVPAGATTYRISTNVQRFESVPGSYALIDATWSVRTASTDAVLTCRSVFKETVGPGYEALVAGHRAAVEKLGAAIAAGVRNQRC
nr:PqiC family protein [uncultured Massilia sp.]